MFAKLIQQINEDKTPLSPEAELILHNRFVGGDEEAGQSIIQAHLRLALVLSLEYVRKGGSLEELFQESVLALHTALERFTPDRNARFATYATWWIRSQLQDFLRENSRQVVLPSHIVEQLTKLTSTSHTFHQKESREPNTDELAAKLGISEDKVLKLQQYLQSSVSLDQSLVTDGIEGSDKVGDKLEDIHSEIADEYASRLDDIDRIKELLPKLSEQERNVLVCRFGLNGSEELTLQATGKQLGISTARVQQIEKSAIEKLRNVMVHG